VAGTISGLVCLAHVVRLFTQFPISLSGYPVPVWMSGIGIIVAGSLAWWFWSLSRSAGSAPPAPKA
jgi:hypothetical protein